MKIIGKVKQLCAVETGSGVNGDWIRQTLVVETLGERPKCVAVTFFGQERVEALASIGEGVILVEVDCDIESREHEGRWYTEARGYKLKTYGEAR